MQFSHKIKNSYKIDSSFRSYLPQKSSSDMEIRLEIIKENYCSDIQGIINEMKELRGN